MINKKIEGVLERIDRDIVYRQNRISYLEAQINIARKEMELLRRQYDFGTMALQYPGSPVIDDWIERNSEFEIFDIK